MKYRIREHRRRLDLTQDQLATRIGSVKSHVSEMESGKKNPSGPMLQKLAEAFDVSVFEMFEDDDLSHELAAWVSVILKIEPQDREAALRAAKGFLPPDTDKI